MREWMTLRVFIRGIVAPASLYMLVVWSCADVAPAPEQSPIESGVEIATVFVTSSGCAGNTYPGFYDLIASVNDSLKLRYGAAGVPVRTVGVAIDWDIESGLNVLDSFGPFDEVSVGNNWLNTGALYYLGEHATAERGVPQFIVIARGIAFDADRPFQVIGASVLARIAGSDRIDEWFRAGLPISPDISKFAPVGLTSGG